METHGQIVRNSWSIFSMVAPKILWCYCSALYWCSEFNISHNSFYFCQIFTKVLVWWIRLHHHWYKLNRLASMMIEISQYMPLTKAIFSRTRNMLKHLKHILGLGLKPPKLPYKVNWDTWSCIVLLEIVVCVCLSLVLGISYIGFTEDLDPVMCCISNGGFGIYHYTCNSSSITSKI